MAFKKLVWKNSTPPSEKILYDIRTGELVARIYTDHSWWAIAIQNQKSFDNPKINSIHNTYYATSTAAKAAVTAFITQTLDENVIIEEDEVLVDIQQQALRNIIACGGKAAEIARDVLHDPSTYLKKLREKQVAEINKSTVLKDYIISDKEEKDT